MKKNGAHAVWQSVVNEGVNVVFGINGGAVLPLYHAMPDYSFHHVLVRHEQGATHAADGYARATGNVGVCIGTSGPGATNMVTGIATAYADSSPIVAITGQVNAEFLGLDAFQEAPITAVTAPITKHNYLVTRAEEIPLVMKEAFHIARSGRPGPVHVDITKDAQLQELDAIFPATVSLQGYDERPRTNWECLDQAAELLEKAERPLVLAGRGVVLAGAEEELLAFVESTQIPLVTSLLGIGSMPENHPLCLGRAGMHGEEHTNLALEHADAIISFGCRFSDRITGKLGTFANRAKIIQVELDPVQLNKTVDLDVGILGDVKEVIPALTKRVSRKDRPQWLQHLNRMQNESEKADILNHKIEGLIPQFAIREIWKATKGSSIVVTDVGQNQQWAAQYYSFDSGNKNHITSGGMGTMGFAVPAAMGAKMGRPDKEVWAIAGDGGFQMTMMELATIVQERVPLKIAIMNNGYLGMVRQWQEMFHDNTYSGVELSGPDFKLLAESFGIPAATATTQEEAITAIAEAREYQGPYLIDFQVEKEENVFPMIAPGAPAKDMITQRDWQKNSD